MAGHRRAWLAGGTASLLCLGASGQPSGVHHQYVIDTITLPTTAGQAQAFGFDLDGNATIDNRLGNLIASFQGLADLDVQSRMDDLVARGDVIRLADLQAESLGNATGGSLRIVAGASPGKPPCSDEFDLACGHHLDGATNFEIAPGAPLGSMVGDIASGTFAGGPGPAQIGITFGTDLVALDLIGARAEVAATEGQLQGGRLGGGVDGAQVVAGLYATIQAILVAEECSGTAPDCCSNPNGTGQTLLGIFDTTGDCAVDLGEFQSNSLITAQLAPDLDLLDADGHFDPAGDGEKDLLSIGVGFSAVGATFPVPEPSARMLGVAAIAVLVGFAQAAASSGRTRRASP